MNSHPPSLVRVVSQGRWSGGGRAVLENLKFACQLFPSKLTFSPGAGLPLVPRNVVPWPLIHTGRYVVMPQNSWAWHGPWGTPAEAFRRAKLKIASDLALSRAAGVIRISATIPGRNCVRLPLLTNVLDPGFEDALFEAHCLDDDSALPLRHAILCVGEIASYRNLERLIDGYGRYREGGGGHSLLIVGGTQFQSYASRLRRRASQVEGTRVWTEALSRTRILTMLQRAAGVIFPSLVEASPITVLEAVCLSDRVVASDIPAHHEIASTMLPDSHFFDPFSTTAISHACEMLEEGPVLGRDLDMRSASYRAKLRYQWANRLVASLEHFQ